MAGPPVRLGMRVLGSDGSDVGIVTELESDHFVVQSPGGEARERFRYNQIRAVRTYVELAKGAHEAPKKRWLRRRRKST